MAMTIRFAAARPSMTAFIGRTHWTLDLPPAGNDNGDAPVLPVEACQPAHQTDRNPLREALLHFAVHGMAAAEEARKEALLCHAGGRTDEARYWLDICRHFDRRMASALARRIGGRHHTRRRNLL